MFTFAHIRQKPITDPNRTSHLANPFEMSNIEHFPVCKIPHHAGVKSKELTLKQVLSVPCPTCGAATGEGCELQTGAERTEPHRARKLSAAEAVETKPGKR
jgi:hypothetical protein